MEKNIIQSVTRSYSRTIQLAQYEPLALFSSRSYSWYEEVGVVEVANKSKELYEECVLEVETELKKFRPELDDVEQANEELSV